MGPADDEEAAMAVSVGSALKSILSAAKQSDDRMQLQTQPARYIHIIWCGAGGYDTIL